MEHGLDTGVIAIFAVVVVLWALVSAILDRLSITPALAFVVVGLVVANPPLSLIDIEPSSETVRSVAEITLALVLFSDAARVDVGWLRSDSGVPLRLLLIALPLTVAAGVGLSLVMFADLDPWVCAVIAAAVAPTDASLGAPLMADRRIPARVRRALNIESGLNDGLIAPVVTFVVAGAVAEAASQPELSLGAALIDLALGVLVGVGVGLVGGVALRFARRSSRATAGAENVAVLALGLLAHAGSVEAGANGLVAAFVGGMVFGTARKATADVLGFASGASELLTIVVWFVFGAIAVPILDDAPWSVAVFAVLALSIGRMVPVTIALAGTGLRRPTVAFLGWFGPRGLPTVVFALIAYDELDPGDTRTTMLAAIVATVLLSVVAHALTARPLADRYAAYVERAGELADVRPTAEPAPRPLLSQQHQAAAGDRTDDPEGDTSTETIGAGP